MELTLLPLFCGLFFMHTAGELATNNILSNSYDNESITVLLQKQVLFSLKHHHMSHQRKRASISVCQLSMLVLVLLSI